MDKRFLGILTGLAVIFVGVFVFTSNNKSNGGNSGNSSQATNHVEGQNKKKVTILEYGDYQCPICGAYYQPLKDTLTPELLKDVQFQFRNLPLTSLHPNAFAAARAAEAAGMQNKYWEMHDKLYENQDPNGKAGWAGSSTPINYFTTFAKDIGLNAEQFKQDYASSKVNDAINADVAEFKKTGKDQATPTFFVNGKYVANSNFSDPKTGAPQATLIATYIQSQISGDTPKK